MSHSNIGIKIADGTFYPILEKESFSRKKLILTTIEDDQTNVQIDLYEGEDELLSSNRYVGSLLIEDVAPGSAGEAEIELLVGVGSDGSLSAQAQDLRSGESQSLSVSLESLDNEGIYDMPDFELDDEFEPWSDEADETDEIDEIDESLDVEDSLSTFENDVPVDSYSDPDQEPDSDPDYMDPPRRKPLLLALFIVFGVAAVAALARPA